MLTLCDSVIQNIIILAVFQKVHVHARYTCLPPYLQVTALNIAKVE